MGQNGLKPIGLQDSSNFNFAGSGLHINIKVSNKLILLVLVKLPKHVQSTQNNKLAISQEYFKKEMKAKFDFLHEDKSQTFLQVDTVNFCGHVQSCPKYPNSKFAKSLLCLKNGQVCWLSCVIGVITFIWRLLINQLKTITNDYWIPSTSWKDPTKKAPSIHPSTHCPIHLSIPHLSPDIFLEFHHYFFSKFWCGVTNPYEAVHEKASVFEKKFFLPQNGGKWAKNRFFLNLLKNLIIFFWF